MWKFDSEARSEILTYYYNGVIQLKMPTLFLLGIFILVLTIDY